MGRIIHVVDGSTRSDSIRFDRFSKAKRGDAMVKTAAMCNGNAQAAGGIESASRGDAIDVLVIYGGGAPGVQGVATGRDGAGIAENSAIPAPCPTRHRCGDRSDRISRQTGRSC